MENYINEIIAACKLPFSEVVSDFKIVQIGKRIIYVCNYKKILDYSNSRVVLKTSKDVLEILGEDLIISLIEKSEIIIKGNIFSCGVAN